MRNSFNQTGLRPSRLSRGVPRSQKRAGPWKKAKQGQVVTNNQEWSCRQYSPLSWMVVTPQCPSLYGWGESVAGWIHGCMVGKKEEREGRPEENFLLQHTFHLVLLECSQGGTQDIDQFQSDDQFGQRAFKHDQRAFWAWYGCQMYNTKVISNIFAVSLKPFEIF